MRAVSALALLVWMACAPDLHEITGPVVPVPNVTGRVLRAGNPAGLIKVKLVETATDSTMDQDRTGPDGTFGFARVGVGDWTLKVSGSEADDFARLTWEFLITGDSILQAPDLDVSSNGLQLEEPAAGDSVTLPSFLRPLRFRWLRPDREGARVQARVFDSADSAVWYSDKMATTEVWWNGLANKGPGAGHPVTAGDYSWELRADWRSSVEGTTAKRPLHLSGPSP